MTLLWDYKQAHTQNFLLGGWPSDVYNLCLISEVCYKNRVVSITVTWHCVQLHLYTYKCNHVFHYSLTHFKSESLILFLGAFAELRNATISFVMSVRPHGRAFLPLDGFSWNLIHDYFFRKSMEKIEVSLMPDLNNGYFTWRPMIIYMQSNKIHEVF